MGDHLRDRPRYAGNCTSFHSPDPEQKMAATPGIIGHLGTVDQLLEAFMSLSVDSSTATELAVERLVDSRFSDSDKYGVIEGAVRLGEALVASAGRCSRRLSARHNCAAWPLPPDLTIKVFSMIDTRSVCHAAVTCSMFNKCARDPLCYANIDLTSVMPKINDGVVWSMVRRAGRNLRSLKLGILPCPSVALLAEAPRSVCHTWREPIDASLTSQNVKKPKHGKESSVLTRSCLLCLRADGDASGSLLTRLQLYNIDKMDATALGIALSACQSLLDLEVVGTHVEIRQILESVSTHCHLIERLFLESWKTGRDENLKSATCHDLVKYCPQVSSLSLRGFDLHDQKAWILIKGFHKLKLVDFSTSYSITGTFLRNSGGAGNVLETLILRDCLHLREVEVARFLFALLAGDFKLLTTLDVSNKDGLAGDDDWYRRCTYASNLPIARVMEARPHMHLVADFPLDESYAFFDPDQITHDEVDSEVDSDTSLPSQVISLSSPSPMSLSESSYTSDQGSGDDDIADFFVASEDNLDLNFFY